MSLQYTDIKILLFPSDTMKAHLRVLRNSSLQIFQSHAQETLKKESEF